MRFRIVFNDRPPIEVHGVPGVAPYDGPSALSVMVDESLANLAVGQTVTIERVA